MNQETKEKLILTLLGIHESSNEENCMFEVGKNYFVQTVTHYYLGKLIAKNKNEIKLGECSWIASTGRFSEFSNDVENVSEMEPTNDTVIFKSGMISYFEPNKLIRKLK